MEERRQNHECLHEGDFGKILTVLDNMALSQSTMRTEVKESMDNIYKILKGSNGNKGLCTEMELMKQTQARLWWAISGVVSAWSVVVGYLLRGFLPN